MSDFLTVPIPITTPVLPPLQLVGDPDAEACVGDVCALPAHREHALVNRRIDSDLI